jgi:C1A family cysteine protease
MLFLKLIHMKKSLFIIFAVPLIMSFFVSCTKENTSKTSVKETPPYSLGCEFLPIAQYEAIPLAQEIELKALPVSVTLATPPIGNQLHEGSCVAWGTTYAGRSIDWYFTNHNTSYSTSTNIFSPEYVYNQIKSSKTNCTSGAYVVAGLNLLKSQGVCRWDLMPYVDGDCYIMPNTAQSTDAANYKISSYNRVNIKTKTIETLLASNQPVIVAGPVNYDFEYLGAGKVLGKYNGNSLGGHCYCIVGYNNLINAFKFQNSWGPDWSSQGYGWISCDYISSWWQEAYVITTTTH